MTLREAYTLHIELIGRATKEGIYLCWGNDADKHNPEQMELETE